MKLLIAMSHYFVMPLFRYYRKAVFLKMVLTAPGTRRGGQEVRQEAGQAGLVLQVC